MNIKYVGNNIYGEYAFREAAEEMGLHFSQADHDEGKRLHELMDGLILENAEIYIIDISCFAEDEKELAEQLVRLKQAVNAKVIIHAPLYSKVSRILLDLNALGFTHIITAMENQGLLRQELMEAVNAACEEAPCEEEQETLIREREENNRALEEELPGLTVLSRQQEKKTEPGSVLKIAVIGSREFIGATTTALQFVKHLDQKQEACAAYIELNKSRYIRNLREYYEVERSDSTLSSITMSGVTMFEDARKMSQILSEGFSYYIYDYGSIGLVNDLSSIYEKDIIILVGGIKPNELTQTTEAMGELYEQRNQFYILNHVPQKNRREALELMADRKDSTYFLEECADPFVYNPNNGRIFDAILGSDYRPEISMKHRKIWRIFK